ncbi:hypothetical protein BKA93DRAFT_284807 [Sparassis latifolia]
MLKAKWMKLKATYTAIETYKSQPGALWSTENGAGINISSEAAWDDYLKVKSHRVMRRFKNNGWSPYDDVARIMLRTARGTYPSYPASTSAASVASVPPPTTSGKRTPNPSIRSSPSFASSSKVSSRSTFSDETGKSGANAAVIAAAGAAAATLSVLQESLQRFAVVFEQTMKTPEDKPQAPAVQAVDLMQKENPGLSSSDIAALAFEFGRQPTMASIFLGLPEAEVRKTFLHILLAKSKLGGMPKEASHLPS